MQGISRKILNRVRGHGRGCWVCTPKDFLDLGSRDAVDKAPPNIDATVAALARRDGILILPDSIVAAHQLGLTNAVPARNTYITNGASRTIQIGGRTLELRHASQRLMTWANRPGAPVVQALDWLGKNIADERSLVDTLRSQLSPEIKGDLANGIRLLPTWMIPLVRQVSEGVTA